MRLSERRAAILRTVGIVTAISLVCMLTRSTIILTMAISEDLRSIWRGWMFIGYLLFTEMVPLCLILYVLRKIPGPSQGGGAAAGAAAAGGAGQGVANNKQALLHKGAINSSQESGSDALRSGAGAGGGGGQSALAGGKGKYKPIPGDDRSGSYQYASQNQSTVIEIVDGANVDHKSWDGDNGDGEARKSIGYYGSFK